MSEDNFGFNKIGTIVRQLLQEHGDIQKTFDPMLEEFDIDADTLASDMKNLIDDLTEKGLISLYHP